MDFKEITSDKVYKVVKALYGLHQAPRAWYETLANYLLGNGFKRGKIDQTLFIKKQKGDILLVQVYVNGISLVYNTARLQVIQKEDGIFISQDKYVAEILKKFNYTDVKSMNGVFGCFPQHCQIYVFAVDLLTKGFDAGRHVKRGRDTKIPQSSGPPVKVGDEAVHKELGDRMERAATTASSLET
ncbi:putative ribonuclease H-like domain-containing protein [Tanacetum coccineum]